MTGLCVGLVSVLLSVMPARAGRDKDVDYTTMSLEQLMAVPVYTAAKHEQTSAQAPSSVTVITSPEIRAYGWRTLSELLSSAPGFYVTYPRTYGFVGVRGFGRPGDFGGRILLLVDGHRMNDPLYDSAAVVNDFMLDLDLIDRVEIVRGPGSALYGNNAFFAVINVVTKRANQPAGLEASGEAGTFDAYRGRLTYAARSNGGTELLVSTSGYSSNGNPKVYIPEYDSPKTDYGIVRGADDESAHSLFGTVRRGSLTIEGAYVGRHKSEPAPGYGTVFGMPRRTFDGRAMLEGRYDLSLTDEINVLTRLSYDWYKYRGDYPYDVAEAGQPRQIVINRDVSVSESVGGEAQLDWRPNKLLAGTVGAEYRYDLRDMMTNFDVSPRADYLDVNHRTRCGALYLQDEFRPWTHLAFTSGVRYDHYDTFGGTLNPRVACIYDPGSSTTLKLLYGRAFRAPNANEFFYEDDGISAKTNPNLQPEKIGTYEVVCEQRIQRAANASVAVFYNHVTSLIDQTQDQVDSLYYDANLGRVDARGLEWQMDCRLAANTRARASYTFTKAKDETTGRPLTNSPEHLGKLNVTGPLWRDWLVLGGEVQYVSERLTVNGNMLRPLGLGNLTISTKMWRNSLDVSMSLYNVLDTRYRDPDASTDSVERDGRTIRLKVAGRF